MNITTSESNFTAFLAGILLLVAALVVYALYQLAKSDFALSEKIFYAVLIACFPVVGAIIFLFNDASNKRRRLLEKF